MRLKLMAMVTFSFIFVCWNLPDIADARRMGGGRSFGSRPQYQRTAPKPAPQQNVQQTAPGAPSPTMARPGLFGGGLGGMLGGLLMGGLIGSLLFGGGHGMGGPGLLDLLLIGGGLYLLFRFLKAKKEATQPSGPTHMNYQSPNPSAVFGSAGSSPAASRHLPPGFDETDFLEGAKAAYVRLQAAWDKRDLEDIRQFTTPEMWTELRRQAEEDPNPGKTEIVLLNASLAEVEQVNGELVASVLFDALLREEPGSAKTESVQEIWHFSRSESDPHSFWMLEGIQQVEQ